MVEILRHKRTGGLYEVLCRSGRVQAPYHDIPDGAVLRDRADGNLVIIPADSLVLFEPARPDSATPSGDGGERATSGEIEGLVDAYGDAVLHYGMCIGKSLSKADRKSAAEVVDRLRTALLSRITSPSFGGDLGELSRRATPGLLALSPQQYDDWGMIRTTLPDAEGFCWPVFRTVILDSDDEQSAARAEQRQPAITKANSDYLIALWNGHRSGRLVSRPTPPDLIQAAREGDLKALLADAVEILPLAAGTIESLSGDEDDVLLDLVGRCKAALRSLQPPHQGLEDGRRPDGHGLSPSVGLASDPAGSAASISDAGEVDFDGLNALFGKIPSGPWDARRDSDGYEIRQIDTDPTNKHHWPFRLCRSIPGQRAGCDEAVFDFLAGVLNAWPQIAAAHSEEAEVERILAMSGDELDARLRLDGRDPDDVLALANYALRTATMWAALDEISSQYVTNRGDMTAEEALAAIKGIADRARDQRAEREDAQRPRPEVASPVDEVEAPSSIVQGNPSPTTGGEAPGRDDTNSFGCLRAYEAVAKALNEASYTAFEPEARQHVVVETVSKVLEAFRLSPASPRSSQKEKGV